MKSWILILILIAFYSCNPGLKETTAKEEGPIISNWKTQVESVAERFGHRNWIVVADAAYPDQSHPAIETITIDASQLEAVEFVADLVDGSNHIEANIFLDKELSYVDEKYARGIDEYRIKVDQILENRALTRLLHEDIIRKLDESAGLFKVLILKTDLAIPYTSVFFQLECGYWNAESEEFLRSTMKETDR